MWVSWLLLAGCRTTCTPTVRADDPQARAVVGELARTFVDQLVPSLEVCVPTIEVVDEVRVLGQSVGGSYHPTTRNIQLATTEPLLVYHELCHALQRQNDLPLDDPRWALDPAFAELVPHRGQGRAEVFAVTCQEALGRAQLIGAPCDSDRGDTSVFSDVTALFTGPDDSVDPTREAAFVETVRRPFVGDTLEIGVLEDGVSVFDGTTNAAFHPASGAPVFPGTPVRTASDPARHDGAALGSMELGTINGAVAVRRVYQDANGVSSPAGCLQELEQFFWFEEAFWSGFVEGGELHLGYWEVRGG